MQKSKSVFRRVPGWFIAIAVVVGLLLVAQLVARRLAADWLVPTRRAEWIWVADETFENRPIAFYAARQFELAAKPGQAKILTVADEEAVILLNGAPVGSERYLDGGPVSSYEVGDLLRQGKNLFLVELRSSRGVGGFLLRLAIDQPDGEQFELVTDNSWRIYRRPDPDSFNGEFDPQGGEEPEVWGPPPTGRWAPQRVVRGIPTIKDLMIDDQPMAPRRYRLDPGVQTWQPLGATDRSSPSLGSWVTLDWGREVTAYLALRFPVAESSDRKPLGLLFFGNQPPRAKRMSPQGYLVGVPGQQMWLDARPRRFRFVSYVGLTEISGAEAYLVDPERVELDQRGLQGGGSGAFGLQVSQLGATLQDEIWREFHRVSSVAAGKER